MNEAQRAAKFGLPTMKVKLKESGDTIKINTTDFDPEVHEKIERKKLAKPIDGAKKDDEDKK